MERTIGGNGEVQRAIVIAWVLPSGGRRGAEGKNVENNQCHFAYGGACDSESCRLLSCLGRPRLVGAIQEHMNDG